MLYTKQPIFSMNYLVISSPTAGTTFESERKSNVILMASKPGGSVQAGPAHSLMFSGELFVPFRNC